MLHVISLSHITRHVRENVWRLLRVECLLAHLSVKQMLQYKSMDNIYSGFTIPTFKQMPLAILETKHKNVTIMASLRVLNEKRS